MRNNKQLLAVALSGLMMSSAQAGEKEELLKLRITTTSLIKQLVKQGVLTENMAEEMIKQAEVDADKQITQVRRPVAEMGDDNVSAAKAAKSALAGHAAAAAEPVPADEVRVAYVPDFVKDEIRQQVRNELKEEVVGDVMQKAKQEQWGLPNALPEWTKKFKLSGDIRLREQSAFVPSDNTTSTFYKDWMAVNNAGGLANALAAPGGIAYLNTTKDRNLARERFRLGVDVDVANGVDAGVRLATGDIRNPTSTNQTLGNTGQRYQFNIDRAFLRYRAYDDSKFNWLSVMAGRTPNPFFTGGSELVWDEDLSFEGAAATLRQRVGFNELSDDIGGKGPVVFATAGIFPLQSSTGLSSRDKWMFGGQTGLDWGFDNQDSLQLAAAYYDYRHIKGKVNSAGQTCDTNSAEINQSIPQFMQGGNSLQPICINSLAVNGTNAGLVGLASDYRILNFTAAYDMALFSPIHVKFSADFAKNIGYNIDPATRLITSNDAQNRTNAWQFKVDLGWVKLDQFGNWNVFTGYKYLERDAVLDAYNDSDMHLGGTNIKGWMLGGNYGLMKNVWLTGRWLSADVITGPKFGLDVMQLDVNTRF